MRAIIAALAATPLGFAAPAVAEGVAAVEIAPTEITCAQFLDHDTELRSRLLYWVDEYVAAVDREGDVTVAPVVSVTRDWFATPDQDLVTRCEANPDMLIVDAFDEVRDVTVVE